MKNSEIKKNYKFQFKEKLYDLKNWLKKKWEKYHFSFFLECINTICEIKNRCDNRLHRINNY